jgi:hypothetical protein
MVFSIAADRSVTVRSDKGLPGVLVEAVDTMLSAVLSAVLMDDAEW